MYCSHPGCGDLRDNSASSVFQLLQVLRQPSGSSPQLSAPVVPQGQEGPGLRPGCHKNPAPFWPRTPPREGQGPSEHLIFSVMPDTKCNTHLPHSTRKSRDFSPAAAPAASSPYTPAWPPPSLLSPKPRFDWRRVDECLCQSHQPCCGVSPVSAGILGSGWLFLQCHCLDGKSRAGIAGAVWEHAGGDAVTFPCLFPTLSSWGPLCRSHFYLFFHPSLSFSPSLFAFFSPPPVSMWADHCSNF